MYKKDIDFSAVISNLSSGNPDGDFNRYADFNLAQMVVERLGHDMRFLTARHWHDCQDLFAEAKKMIVSWFNSTDVSENRRIKLSVGIIDQHGVADFVFTKLTLGGLVHTKRKVRINIATNSDADLFWLTNGTFVS